MSFRVCVCAWRVAGKKVYACVVRDGMLLDPEEVKQPGVMQNVMESISNFISTTVDVATEFIHILKTLVASAQEGPRTSTFSHV